MGAVLLVGIPDLDVAPKCPEVLDRGAQHDRLADALATQRHQEKGPPAPVGDVSVTHC
jgi:hypothetical protein